VVETTAALEHLAEVAALERSPRQRRMLVIINPYATTMSDRVRNLVVYALQGRYDVQAVDTQAKGHAIELCREAAHEGYDVVVAFGGDGTVNEAANGLVGSPTPLTCLPGGATNVYCRMLGSPTTSSTPRSTCSASPTRGASAGSTSAGSATGASCSAPAWGSTPAWSSASTATRG
jgi:diacylglycerol kinase family enzyme